jgi:hypothetical protein
MNKLLKMLVFLTQMGGGLVGLGFIGRSLFINHLTSSLLKLHLVFAGMFLFGVLASAALIIKPKWGLVLSAIFQIIQIPVVTVSAAAYAFSSGVCFNLYKHASGWGFKFFFGSYYYFHLNSDRSWLVGVNIVALFFFAFLIREIWLNPSGEKSTEFPPCRGYSSLRYSKEKPHLDNSGPLRYTIQ